MQGGECRQSALQALRVLRSEGVSLRELSQRVDTNSRLAAKRRGYCCSARLVSSRQGTCSRRGSVVVRSWWARCVDVTAIAEKVM